MRAIMALTAAVGILAGCGQADEAGTRIANENGKAEAASASNGSIAPPSHPEPARADAIPPAFHGVYDQSAEACGRPSEYRMTVLPGEVRFHESIGTVRSVAVDSASAVSVAADFQGEGESWRAVHRLELRDGGSRLTMTADDTIVERVRCPEAR